jgi:DNA-directed RNA polymerase subunit RPC12/RpoP
MGLLLGFAIFGIVDVFLWVVVIKIGINNIGNKQVAEKGEDFTATVSYINSNVTINGVPKYKVHYTWVGGDGTTKSGSSGSVYMLHEAEALEQAKTIDIKVIGKRSVIMTSPDTCLHQHYNNVEGSVADKNTQQLKCDYCGHHITESDEYCSNCGARVNFNKY